MFLETIVGTNGILIPPDGYIKGVREICDRYGILMVADEVMAGFGRTGRWFAVDHWDVVPDLMTMAKGLTSSYLPLGAVAMREHIAEALEDKMFFGGPDLQLATRSASPRPSRRSASTRRTTSSATPRAWTPSCAATTRRSRRSTRRSARIATSGCSGSSTSSGRATRGRRSRRSTARSDEMKAIGKFLRDNGVYTMIANNSIHTNPPLCITEAQLAEGFEIIDRALDIADQAVSG